MARAADTAMETDRRMAVAFRFMNPKEITFFHFQIVLCMLLDMFSIPLPGEKSLTRLLTVCEEYVN